MWGSSGDRMPSFVSFDEFLKCCVDADSLRLFTLGRISAVGEATSGMDTATSVARLGEEMAVVDKEGW